MKYNSNKLIVSSTITQLENDLQDIVNDMEYFKSNIKTKFDNLEIEMDENASLLEAIKKLKQLNNTTEIPLNDMYNGIVYDLANESINKNEIKAVVLVKPGQRIEFTIGLKSHIKPANQFTTGANQFITVDWGDGTATQGYNYFCHTYENLDCSSLKPFNDDYKQAIITIRPTCYLEEEDILMPQSISFVTACRYNVIGINVNFIGITSEYYVHSYPTISMSEYKNLRYYYTTEAYIATSFQNCYRLEKIKANKLFINANSYNCFMDCWSLALIDADIVVDKEYSDTSRYSMFQDCYNLVTIKSLDLGVVTNEANYDKLFANCFKLKAIPKLSIDCSISRSTTCEFFYNCMSLENPFQYLINTNMLRYAYRLFYGCHQIIEAPEELDFSLATNTNSLFSRCINMKIPPKRLYLDSSTNCSYMFDNCWLMETTPSILTTNIDCSNVNYMFNSCFSLITVNCDLVFPNVSNSLTYMFQYCYSLTGFNCNVVRFGITKPDEAYSEASRHLFTHSYNLVKLPKQEWTSRYLELSSGYNQVNIEEYPDEINLVFKASQGLMKLTSSSEIKKMPKVINIPDCTGSMNLFSNSTGVKRIENLTINIGSATSISSMFSGCYQLESINNLTINAPNATSMSSLFANCYNLKTLNNVQINLKPDSAITMTSLFDGCYSLETVPNLGIEYERASNFSYAFRNTQIKEAIFDKSFDSITNVNYAFYQCRKLKRITMIINNDVTDYNYWISNNTNLKNLDLQFTLPNSSRNIVNNLTLGNTLVNLKLDFNNTTWNNNSAWNISGYNITHLKKVEIWNYANTGNITLDSASRLDKFIITFKQGVYAHIYLRNGKLSVEALNEFFNNLPSGSNKTLYLKGQANINECDQSIATSKGWTINTTT